jgi:hypothetical protein
MLVSTEPGGLGNRIKSWVSATRLDPDARVCWPRTPNMPASFAELFTNDCAVDSMPDGAIEHCSWQLALLPAESTELAAGFATVVTSTSPLRRRVARYWWNLRGRQGDRYRYMVAPKRFSRQAAAADGRTIDFEYGRIPEYFRQIYAPLFARVAAQADIRDRVEAFAAEHFHVPVIGVQVRTWRDSPRRHRKHFRPAVSRLQRLLQSAGDEPRFFVVSDDDEVAAWLGGIVGARRIIEFPRATRRLESWQSTVGMQEDLIDMLLLARAPVLYASYLSTFSETAWWLGGATASVSVF